MSFSLILSFISSHGNAEVELTETLNKNSNEFPSVQLSVKNPISSRNLDNDVEDDVVNALAMAVTNRFSDLSHRYYKLKAKWFGKEKLNWWPSYSISKSVQVTTEWYYKVLKLKENPETVTNSQIEKFMYENNWR